MGRGLSIMASQKLPSRKGREAPNIEQKVPSSVLSTGPLTVAGSPPLSSRAPRHRDTAAPRHGELQYLEQVEHMCCGFKKEDCTSIGTLSVFGMQAPYNLRGDRG